MRVPSEEANGPNEFTSGCTAFVAPWPMPRAAAAIPAPDVACLLACGAVLQVLLLPLTNSA